MKCQIALGRTAALCACRLTGGGWLPCPSDQLAPIQREAPRRDGSTVISSFKTADDYLIEMRATAFTGNFCPDCGSDHMIRNGTCEVCLNCGTTTGCS